MNIFLEPPFTERWGPAAWSTKNCSTLLHYHLSFSFPLQRLDEAAATTGRPYNYSSGAAISLGAGELYLYLLEEYWSRTSGQLCVFLS
jgi:hypothetical protein